MRTALLEIRVVVEAGLSPLDAMVTRRLIKDFLFAVGASKQVVQSHPS
jgi:hypothetical protein